MRALRIALAAAVLAGSVVGVAAVGIVPASAADSCGSGFHKQEDGDIYGTKTARQDGKAQKGTVSGKIRWCTRTVNNWPDQRYQRVIVGLPSVTGRGAFSGTRRIQICERFSFTADISGGGSADISISTDGVGATISSPTTHSKTVALPKRCVNGSAAQSTTALQNSMYNFSATAKNVSWNSITCPHISMVTVTVDTSMTYRYGSEIRSFSLRTLNRDVPNGSIGTC